MFYMPYFDPTYVLILIGMVLSLMASAKLERYLQHLCPCGKPLRAYGGRGGRAAAPFPGDL